MIVGHVYRVRTSPLGANYHAAEKGSLVVITGKVTHLEEYAGCYHGQAKGFATNETLTFLFRPCDLSKLANHAEVNA